MPVLHRITTSEDLLSIKDFWRREQVAFYEFTSFLRGPLSIYTKMKLSEEYPYYRQPTSPNVVHSTSSGDQFAQRVRASIMPEVVETIGIVRRDCERIIEGRVEELSGTIERVERRQIEQQQEFNTWRAKTEQFDTELNDMRIRCNWTVDRMRTVVHLNERVLDEIPFLKSRIDALDSHGRVGPGTPLSPPRSVASPHVASVFGSRMQHASDVLRDFGRPGTMASPTSTTRQNTATPSAPAASQREACTLEARPGYARCPLCHKELTKNYMGTHLRKHCKKSLHHI